MVSLEVETCAFSIEMVVFEGLSIKEMRCLNRAGCRNSL
jgi:hypothetical protein